MNMQDPLFHEDWRDSLKHVVKALGGYEAAGKDLWPGKTRKAAGSWLYDCLDAVRPAKLDLEEIQALLQKARDKGIHTGMYILADEVGYERPQPAAPKSPRTIWLEKQARAAAEMLQAQQELDRLDKASIKLAR